MCAYDIEIRIKQKKGLAYIIGFVIVFVFAYILLFELFQVQYEIIIILNNF